MTTATRKHRSHETFQQLLDALLEPTEHLKAFSQRSGVGIRTVWRLRLGDGKRPFRPTVVALAKALGCSTERVLSAIAESHRIAKGGG